MIISFISISIQFKRFVGLLKVVELLECIEDFLRSADVASESSVESYRYGAVHCKSYIVYHLAGRKFDGHCALNLRHECLYLLGREREEGDRTEKSGLDSRFP